MEQKSNVNQFCHQRTSTVLTHCNHLIHFLQKEPSSTPELRGNNFSLQSTARIRNFARNTETINSKETITRQISQWHSNFWSGSFFKGVMSRQNETPVTWSAYFQISSKPIGLVIWCDTSMVDTEMKTLPKLISNKIITTYWN